MSAKEDHTKAAAAVLVSSEAMPHDAVKVVGADFNLLKAKAMETGSGITVDDLLASMATTGFQASSLGQAIKVIDEMV